MRQDYITELFTIKTLILNNEGLDIKKSSGIQCNMLRVAASLKFHLDPICNHKKYSQF